MPDLTVSSDVDAAMQAANAAAFRTAISAVGTVVSGVTGADQVTNVISLTQAEYDAIGSPSSSTLYVITDTDTEVSVTTTATLSLNRKHVCSGTSADYTVTLPTASGNAGKFVQVRVASSCTKLITVDGNSTELIDAASSVVLIANETILLISDGTGWATVGENRDSPSSEAVLGSSYTITTSGVFENTGLTLELPAPGTYLVAYNVRGSVQASGGTAPYYITARLYDATSAASVANTERLVILTSLTTQQQGQSAFSAIITTTQKTTINMQASRNQIGGSPTWTGAYIFSDAAGYSTLAYTRLK